MPDCFNNCVNCDSAFIYDLKFSMLYIAQTADNLSVKSADFGKLLLTYQIKYDINYTGD